MSRRRQKARPCPTAAKTPYPDQATADLALSEIRALAHVREKIPVRSYLCPCGRWHLTSMSKERALGG